ncbi:MAG: hypothetical protein IPL82_09865 [Elusimicrobia bacterium]|nr:hypothetical protein [Elusimicrobiota bacterium]
MNSKHTPGPWNFSKDGAEIFPETGPNGYVELCRVVGPWDGSKFYDKGTAKANARLIAAAPEMLEALKSWLQFWDAMPKGQLGKIVCNIGFLNEAFLKTASAIAKAEGKP